MYMYICSVHLIVCTIWNDPGEANGMIKLINQKYRVHMITCTDRFLGSIFRLHVIYQNNTDQMSN